eukprot:TRINITY_DN31240_c0_g1_i1.p1 TRINITY_DN31240_c0_g1~~TRINITY_DN31240_c0_g1_i1.p1  ORF type:complete len:322 (+),score=40.41 TRINITY_DN31240_c0_g1_i1:97-1062(+)
MLDIDVLIERLKNGEMLEAEELIWLCSTVKDILVEESNVKKVESPVTIVGDVHGQFYDLLELFRVGGWPPDTNYLFLGDYVDRGYYCVETISLLFCYKVRYPARLTLLRGNHETRSTSVVYGFYHECLLKYNNPEVWVKIMDAFDCLTISAVVSRTIFAVHGGLSPAIQDVSHIKSINRFREIPKDGPFSDLMWSDPDQQYDGFTTSARGAGYQFGEDIVDVFLHRNNLSSVVRAHQLCSGGYQLLFDGKCATVWSAPNYCYRCKNEAAILEVDSDLLLSAQGRPQPRHFNVFAEAPEHVRKRPKNIPVVLDESDNGDSEE